MKINSKVLSVSLAAIFFSCAANAVDIADGKLTIDLFFQQQWQSGIEVDGSMGSLINPGDGSAESGFNRMRFALHLNAQISDRISAFIELAEEPNDFAEVGEIENDLAWIQFNFTDDAAVRLGAIVATTMNFLRYTDGAVVQSNPLIGNGVNDIITAESGAWFTGTHKVGLGTWDWNITVTRPSFFEDFNDDAGYNFTLRSSVVTKAGFGIGAGYFKSTGDMTCPTPTTCTMQGGFTRGGGPLQGDGDPYSFAASSPGLRNKHVGLAPGIEADAWQLDVMYSSDKFTVHGFFGQVEDDFSFAQGDLNSNTAGFFSTTDAEYDFFGLFGKVDLSEKVYLAARYTATSNEAEGITGAENIERIQVAAGYWVNDSVLFKAEYVYQDEEAFSGGGVCTFGTTDCDWDGIVLEVSVAF